MRGDKLDSENTILNSKGVAADVLERQSSSERESGVKRSSFKIGEIRICCYADGNDSTKRENECRNQRGACLKVI